MLNICDPKLKKQSLLIDKNENEDFFDHFKNMLNNLSSSKSIPKKVYGCVKSLKMKKDISRCQCLQEEQIRKYDLKKKIIMQKLKRIHKINVEDLTEEVKDFVIMKVENLEKWKKEQKKKSVTKILTILNRLLEEQIYKQRGRKYYVPGWRRKTLKSTKVTCEQDREEPVVYEESEGKYHDQFTGSKEALKHSAQKMKFGTKKKEVYSNESFDESSEQENVSDQTFECPRPISPETLLSEINVFKNFLHDSSKQSKPINIERSLECSPKCIIFQNYEKNKVYLEELKLKNIGLKTIHCRYLGIVVQEKSENRFPIGVAVRDNIKLQPGLSFSTKIRFFCKDASKNLECFIAYETRRQNFLLDHSCFFVPVVCTPARAIVKISPLKLIFPALTWCFATSLEGSNQLKKYIRIENTGGKACYCKIFKETKENDKTEDLAEINEEVGEENSVVKCYSNELDLVKKPSASNNSLTSSGQTFTELIGEEFIISCNQATKTAAILVDEVIKNIFSTFRFSEKYWIEIPPFTTKQIEVKFVPEYKGFHHEIDFIQFEDCHNCVEEKIELIGTIKNLPLSVDPQVIDLKICIMNSGVYSGKFKIYNESEKPYCVTVKIPSSIRKHALVYPRKSIIQSCSYSDFSVKIFPQISLARDTTQYYKEDFGILEFPIFIYPANIGECKADYIKVYVFALITNYTLELSPPNIDFGTVTTLETVRAQIQLKNHSLIPQDFGFLNLPMGVRIEPNMGFGKILPKESIPLYVMYSPVVNHIEKNETKTHSFQVAVTSIAQCGGFGEKLEFEQDLMQYFDNVLEENYDYKLKNFDESSSFDTYESEKTLDSKELDEFCGEIFFEKDKQLHVNVHEKEEVIRNYIKQDQNRILEHSIFNKIHFQNSEISLSKHEKRKSEMSQVYELEEVEEELGKERNLLRSHMNIIICRAVVLKPYYEFSESVILLPATPCSSFSFHRFCFYDSNESVTSGCKCSLDISKKPILKGNHPRFQARFEFQYCCPQIKLEPQSGYLKAGSNLPVTVIYRPQVPTCQLPCESNIQMANNAGISNQTKRKASKTDTFIKNKKKGNKFFQDTIKKAGNETEDRDADEFLNSSKYGLEKSDFFDEERNLLQLINPFHFEVKIQCVVKTSEIDGQTSRTEIHNMIVVCPVIKPSFVYLGSSLEINFSTVFVGTRPKIFLKVKNISIERISPSISLLNPVGSFFCPGGLRNVAIDPEHIWYQPLTYAPLESKGMEKEYFEIRCGASVVSLMVKGTAIMPKFNITPNFACCWIGKKLDTLQEIKIELENMNYRELKLQFVTDFVKETVDLEACRVLFEGIKELNDNGQHEENKKIKISESEQMNFQTWKEIPEMINSAMKNFKDFKSKENISSPPFFVMGLDDNNEVIISPMAKYIVKIFFKAENDKYASQKIYAVKYKIMLEKITPLKEILFLGTNSKQNDRPDNK